MEPADLSHHTSRRFNEDLEHVRSKVLAMGGLIEEQLAGALSALIDGDSSLGQSVARNDYKVNGMEVSIGDECEKIAHIAARLAEDERPADRYREVKHLGRITQAMVRDTLDAFARLDAGLAITTARNDRMVDEEYEAIQRQCITFMMEDPRLIRRALDLMWVVRALERVGDHAKNVCEYVVYMVHGKDIRHTSLEAVEQELRSQAARG
jgi:phosphate transport system protein